MAERWMKGYRISSTDLWPVELKTGFFIKVQTFKLDFLKNMKSADWYLSALNGQNVNAWIK